MAKRIDEMIEEVMKTGKIGMMSDDPPLTCPYCKGTSFILFVDRNENQYRCESCGASGPVGEDAYSAIQKMNKDLNRLAILKAERAILLFSIPNKKEESCMKSYQGTTNTVVGAIEMLESLQEAVKNAGGTPERLSVDELKNMTAMDLIAQLGCNDIRFCSGKAERV